MSIRNTTTFRLTAMLGLAFLCAMCTLLGLIYVLTERELVARTDEMMSHAAQALAEMPAGERPQGVKAAVAANTSHLNRYALVNANGRVLAGDFTPPANLRPDQRFELPPGPDNTPALRLLALHADHDQLLVVGRDITQIADLRHRFGAILISSGLVAFIVLFLAAVLLSMPPLRRIQRLTALAQRIVIGELSLRMPVSSRGDELDVIAETVNTMIEEIARLLEQVKGATDAIAHDLRAPLAQMRGRLEKIRREVALPPSSNLETPEGVTAGGQIPPDVVTPTSKAEELIDTALVELDTVLARFNALLRISELEAANRQAGFGLLDPMALAAAVCELFEPLAEERHIRLMLSGIWGHIIHGDENLLFEVISNLVENAIKFIPSGGNVIVAVTQEGASPVLIVRDDGPGIPVDERANVLRRFHRGAAARLEPGSGLGLSLVAAIIHLHGFSLNLDDARPGLVVKITCDGKL